MWEDRVQSIYILDPKTGEPSIWEGEQGTVQAIASHCNVPVANAAAPVNLPAPGAANFWAIHSVEWSYNATPTNGSLTITDGGVRVFYVYITDAGPGFFGWPSGLRFNPNSQVVVTLAAGGAAVSGTLNVAARIM